MGVENNALLNLLDILAMKLVVTNAQLLNAEIRLESITYRVATLLSDSAVENLKLNESFVIVYEICNGVRALVADIWVSEVEVL